MEPVHFLYPGIEFLKAIHWMSSVLKIAYICCVCQAVNNLGRVVDIGKHGNDIISGN